MPSICRGRLDSSRRLFVQSDRMFATIALFVLCGLEYIAISSASCKVLEAELNKAKYLFNKKNEDILPMNCTSALITAPRGRLIQIKFTRFDGRTTESCANITDSQPFIKVFDYKPGIAKATFLQMYCGKPLSKNIFSIGNWLYLKFSSNFWNSTTTRQAFALEYSAVQDPSCGPENLIADINNPKNLTSPNYPGKFSPSLKCEWLITAPPDHLIQLKFIVFKTLEPFISIKPCEVNIHSVIVYDSKNILSRDHLLGSYCGSSVPANVISTNRHLYIKFMSISSLDIVMQIFWLEYNAIPSTPKHFTMCSPFYPAMQNYNKMKLKATTDYQVIRSPLYPDKYPSRYQCTWIISASKNTNKIKLNITDLKISNYKNPSCGSARIDVLQILDGGSYSSPLLKQFCAPDSETTVVSSAESMTVVFRTNYDNYFTGNTAGFEAKFIEIQEEIGGVNVALIVGVAVAVFVAIGLIVCGVCYLRRRRSSGYQQTGTASAVEL